jgi:hypothetical protein
MKISPGGWLIGMLLTGMLLTGGISAQVVIPAMPKKLVTRPIGGSSSGGVEVMPKGGSDGQKERYTTHFVLSEDRQWTSSDGQTLQAKLIAFEDMVMDKPNENTQLPPPVPPANPTVIRNGKIRLLSQKKPFELALERLNHADRDFVAQIHAAHAKKPSPPSP